MARKDSIKKLKVVLIQRREALIKALAGDNSLLNEMSKQTSGDVIDFALDTCLLYTSPSPRDRTRSRMPSSA